MAELNDRDRFELGGVGTTRVLLARDAGYRWPQRYARPHWLSEEHPEDHRGHEARGRS